MTDDTALDGRAGLPADLRLLLERYPRESWQAHANLGEMARFWLRRHDMFRELGASLDGRLADWREGRMEAGAFTRWYVPRLEFFLGELDAHHRIEDHHYFPLFRQAEPGLVRGFDILDRDHETIHESILETATAARGLLRSLHGKTGNVARARDDHAAAGERLLRRLLRHLEDEEDLVVPVILEHSEARIGLV